MSIQTKSTGGLWGEDLLILERCWKWPMTLWAESWVAWAALMWPYAMPVHPHLHLHANDEHDPLIVPAPIETTGEHALFA